MGNGEVITRAGKHMDEPEHVVLLYLKPKYSRHPTSIMPLWFKELLQASRGPYHLLAEVAHALNNPAAYAKVKWYHCVTAKTATH